MMNLVKDGVFTMMNLVEDGDITRLAEMHCNIESLTKETSVKLYVEVDKFLGDILTEDGLVDEGDVYHCGLIACQILGIALVQSSLFQTPRTAVLRETTLRSEVWDYLESSFITSGRMEELNMRQASYDD